MRFFAVAAGLVAAVSAYTLPVPFSPTADGAAPSGNPVYLPDTTHPVTLGKAFDITWTATSPGPIALVLCEGPSTNCVPTLTIADKVPNSGSFSWTPEGIAPSADSSSGYGIMLIDWTTKQYQYTTQFGCLPNPAASASPSSTLSAPTTTAVVIPPSSPAVPTTTLVAVTTTKVPLGTASVGVPTASSPAVPAVPTSVPASAPSSPVYTGAADHNLINYGAVGALAGLAALLAF